MRITIPFKLVSLDDDGYHCIVKGTMNGRPLLLVVDTGASRSCFDIDLIKEINQEKDIIKNESMTSGIGSNKVDSVVSKIEILEIEGLQITNYQAVGINMEHIHHAYSMASLPKIEGILGADILTKHNAIIDFRKNIITINSKSSRNNRLSKQ